MKKLIVIGLISWAMILNVKAQGRFSLGVEGGPNYTYFKTNNIDKNGENAVWRFSAGLVGEYRIVGPLSAGLGLSFEQKGQVTDYMETDMATAFPPFIYNEWRTHDRFHYLTMPAFLRITLGKKIRYFFNAGGFVSHLLKLQCIVQSKVFPVEKYDYTRLVLPLDYGLLLGTGMSVVMKDHWVFSLELRNNIGMHDLLDDTGWSYNRILKSNAIDLRAGVAYQFGH